ncbi:hypothetical protein KIW84_020429 [Lathyrus oleraceus]|uniref:Uncharacterized protein n=1 Tax=Pisum sativum TaxID=3888 RepID=A0A9D4Y6A8_PEA|nr:hypothetical protein KIW84_020429 [Pisum sativum]
MILAWNVMGLNNAWKSREIGACLNSMKPDPVILIETIVKISKSRAIRNKLGYSWSYADNYLNDDNGRIWILWDESRIKAQDRVGGILFHDVEYTDLVNMMENTDLFEKDSSGDPFTWSNKKVNGTIYSRIYRVIGNMKWHQQNMIITLKIMEPEVSDHAMIFLQDQELRLTRKKAIQIPKYGDYYRRIPYCSAN